MKICDKKQDFPEIKPGDNVKNIISKCLYIVTEDMNLVNLEDGNFFRTGSTWGNSSPKSWQKVECCVQEL